MDRLRDFLSPSGKRTFPYRLGDALIGFDDGVETGGERLGKNIRSVAEALLKDPVGTVGGAVMGAKNDLDDLMFRGGAERRPGDVFGYAAGSAAPAALARAPAGALRSGPAGNDKPGIRAYHGSPHSFDRFSMDKIGTGEGAQAYGHGLYFAENEGVAQHYQRAVQNIDASEFDKIGVPPSQWSAAQMFARDTTNQSPEIAARDFAQWVGREVTPELVEAFRRTMKPGNMYEVRINADPDGFLDWDAPLSEQPGIAKKLGYRVRSMDEINSEAEAIFAQHGQYPDMPPEAQRRLEELQEELNLPSSDMTGERVYFGGDDTDFIHAQVSGRSPGEAANERFNKAGIPGIKYRDAGSRGLDGQEGTRNYVVFDENLIEIVRKYGIAGAAAMLGMTAAEVEAATGQSPLGDYLNY